MYISGLCRSMSSNPSISLGKIKWIVKTKKLLKWKKSRIKIKFGMKFSIHNEIRRGGGGCAVSFFGWRCVVRT